MCPRRSTRCTFPRAPQGDITNKAAYEYFAGLDANRNPTWTDLFASAEPVFVDPRGGLDIVYVVFNPGLGRYILTTPREQAVEKLGVFEAPEPWGPWRTVAYYDDWGGFSNFSLGYYFPGKWISSDGRTMWLVFSSVGILDSFNLVKAELKLRGDR
jgi:hypothetical protein